MKMSEEYSVNKEDLDQALTDASIAVNEYNQNKLDAQVAGVEANKEDAEILQTQEDPRNQENWGFKGLLKEGQSIISGGLQDTASSLATFPERTIDAFSGEMKQQKLQTGNYRPDWTPFGSYTNPIETRTWWGRQLRGLVHFGSLAVGTILAAKGVAATGIVSIPAGLTAFAGSSVLRGAAVGAASDLISKESDEHNALGALRDRYGWIDTPLSTKDTDHPIMMKMKNIVEGMGIGLIFDGLAYTLGKGSSKAVKQITDRNNSLKKQTTEAALAQLRRGETEFRADKNLPLAQSHQGAHISEVDPDVAMDQLSKTRKDWGSEEGSTGSVTTPLERERISQYGATTDDVVNRILGELMSTDKFAKALKAAKGDRKKLAATFRESVEAHQRITQGRNPAEMSAEEYLKELIEAQPDIIDGVSNWTSKNVVIADLIVGTLLKQLRDTGIAGREIADLVDLNAVDGPTKQIVDTMMTALYETKKARFVKSDSFRNLGAGKNRKKIMKDTLTKEMNDTRDAVQNILKIAGDSKDDNLLNALYEAFSMMDEVHNLDDFDKWARTVLKGGPLHKGDIDRTGTLIRELQGMMTNSILSGPKTPARAIMGTSTATFLRPLATALGYTIRLPFTGDVSSLRASLASVNAMVEAVPESFELFRKNLNSYWKGDIRTIKTRFSEYTAEDNNWEILRRWAEDSGRASEADKAAFRLANMARSANNTNLLTYSTKIMAATDDAFGFILGRAKMREKAMRAALNLENNGIQIPKLTKDVMKAYEDDFYSQVFDNAGNIVDDATKFAKKEVTLTNDLTGLAKGLNDVFTSVPLIKPFFLFARTGVNGLALTGKFTPGFNFLVKEFNDIAFANPKEMAGLSSYGITTVEELANARALQTGRLAIGSSIVFMAIQAWMRGDLTGNGPVDRQKRQMWLDNKWEPRSIKIGDVRIGYDSMEPFNLIMSTIADIGDASELMGEEWTENELGKVSLVIAQAVTGKSYMSGLQQFVDVIGGRPGKVGRIGAGLLNNIVPLAGLRNEMGKLFFPYMREINSGIKQSIRNRNLLSEYLTSLNPNANPLPIKYDMLNGKPINDHDFMTRAYNAFSPVSLNLDQSEGRNFLFDSGYDLRLSTYYAPDGTNLTDHPEIRSLFQQAIGDQNLELQLIKLAKDPKAIASLEDMYNDIRSGRRADYNARDYWHNQRIDALFQRARRIAWAKIKREEFISKVILEQLTKKAERERKRNLTLENMYK